MPSSPIGQIRNNPLAGRLLSEGVARPIPTDVDWTDGVNFLESCGGVGGTWGCTDSFGVAEKNIADSPVSTEFKSFLAYLQSEANCANGVDHAVGAAQTAYARLQSAIWAQELHTSSVGNPDLVGSATDITPGGGAEPLMNSLCGLISEQLECGSTDILIHAPFHTLPAFLAATLVEFVAGRYMMGGIPVSFDLYPNLGPTGNIHDPAGAGEAWLYATGPVEWAARPVDTAVDKIWRQNTTIITPEQLGILRFDPCCATAVLAIIC